MTNFKLLFLLPLALLAITCSQSSSIAPTPTGGSGPSASLASNSEGSPIVSAQAATPLSASIQFGQPNAGSPFPPDPPHDQSGHARDNLVPRTVVIRRGGTVTFNAPAGVHQIAIYEPGTEPDDIDTTDLTTLAAFAGCVGPPVVNAPLVIDDETNRVAAYPIPCFAPAQRTHTFTDPGRYLVICAFLPHFNVQMWGWVIVK